MTMIDGVDVKKVVSYRYSDFVVMCAMLQGHGWELRKAKKKIQWPFFWIVKYKARFAKPFIAVVNEDQFSYINKNDITP